MLTAVTAEQWVYATYMHALKVTSRLHECVRLPYQQIDRPALKHPLVEGLEQCSPQQVLDVIRLGLRNGDVLHEQRQQRYR